jgi:Putative Ig domain
MKYLILLLAGFSQVPSGLFAQSNFWDSKDAYLGEMPPGDTPKIFAPGKLLDSGYFSCDRLIFSQDGKEIYYGTNTKWYDGTDQKIKCVRFENGRWSQPFVVYKHYNTQVFSIDGKTMYTLGGPDQAVLWQSQRTEKGWETPAPYIAHTHPLYDFVPTASGQIYGATNDFTGSPKRPGNFDVCMMTISGKDTAVKTLGVPINAAGWNGDFYISPDESYLIISDKETKDYECQLYISYRKGDHSWTNPKSLGPLINSEVSHRWGVTISPDNKYLFYTFGETPKATAIYWVRFDRLLESLRHSNFEPYVKDSIPDASVSVNQNFSIKLSEQTFYDDDGNNSLKYQASLADDRSLPDWIKFDPRTLTLSGNAPSPGETKIKITATDPANSRAVSIFFLKAIN